MNKMNSKDKANRLDQLLQFLDQNPDSPFILFALAMEYQKTGNLIEAGNYFKELVDAHPTYLGTYYHFGKWLEDMDAPEEALRIYDKGIQVAEQQKDQHAKSELMNAKMNLELGL